MRPDGPGQPLLVVSGTTASGKNRVGARLAAALGGEVISLDSMKVYRGMDVGTDKPDPGTCRLAPHHLLDILAPGESMNLRWYVDLAHQVREEIQRRGRLPVVVGGTALYLNGFLKGVFEGPEADPEFRRGLRAEAKVLGVPALHERLRQVDPAAAARIHPNDYKRIERALEVYALQGRPISDLQVQWGRPPSAPYRLFILTWPRAILDERINQRVERMFRNGVLDEVQRILEEGGFGRASSQARGYRETISHLRGEITLNETVALVKRRTRRFARRQLTWFRRMKEARWIEGRPGETADDLAARIRCTYLESLR